MLAWGLGFRHCNNIKKKKKTVLGPLFKKDSSKLATQYVAPESLMWIIHFKKKPKSNPKTHIKWGHIY